MPVVRRLGAIVLLSVLLVGLTVLPVAAARTYTVQEGDTLSAIAERFNTTVEAIAEANNIADPNLIYVGQVLTIPGDDDGSALPPAAPSEPAPAPPPEPAPTPPPAPPAAGRTGPDSILARTRVLTYYGNPMSALMGILGELSKEQLVARLRQVAAEHEQAGGRPVKPAIHLVATVANDYPGPEGLWRTRMPAAVIQEYADLAAANDMLFFVDIQIGHSTWAAEIEAMRPFLSQPHVHLAMDPEFDMAPGQAPGEYIGSTSADDINHAIRYLAGLSGELNLPPKILIVHQFMPYMIRNKAAIEDDPRVDVVIDMDGFGGQQIKIDHYHAFVRDQPVEFGGIKLFYRQDVPVMTPQEILALDPSPLVVIYQ